MNSEYNQANMIESYAETSLSSAEQDERYGHLLPEFRETLLGSYPDWKHHNRQHGEKTGDTVLLLRDELIAAGVDVPSKFVCLVSAWGHDSGLGDYDETKFDCPEHYSAWLVDNQLSERGVDEGTRFEIWMNIWATNADEPCITTGQKLTRFADIYNTSGSYADEFYPALINIEEEMSARGKTTTRINYVLAQIGILSKLLGPDLSFDGYEVHGERTNTLRENGIANILRLVLETAKEANATARASFLQKAGALTVSLSIGNTSEIATN